MLTATLRGCLGEETYAPLPAMGEGKVRHIATQRSNNKQVEPTETGLRHYITPERNKPHNEDILKKPTVWPQENKYWVWREQDDTKYVRVPRGQINSGISGTSFGYFR